MDGNRRNFFRKQPNKQFKRRGISNNRRKSNNLSHEQSSENSHPDDTVYRILCPSRKIGGVIGKGGGIVKSMREETQAKITVADSVAGSDERVIIIYSSSAAITRKQNSDEVEDSAAENQKELMQPHCPAQDALLKVHDRIVEDDGGMESDEDHENFVVTVRLLVPNNMVGCLLGKRGDVIQRLRSETGANIRVLPAEHLPSCAMSTDELVQISGKSEVAKRALYEVSTLLHQNPRKDKPPSSIPMPYRGQSFLPPGGPMTDILPSGNPMWSHRHSSSHGMPPPPPWMGEYRNQPPGFGPGGFDRAPPGHGGEASAEFSMKILCSAAKIGGVIGKGGFNVKQLQQDTGASIHVEDASTDSDERVIRISAFEASWNQRSQTIEAILQLQNKTSEFSEKGAITTRLLVPSSKVGCLLGQGGHVINEMRRRTQADIRVYSKDEKPKCAPEDEELVQISGTFGVAKEALAEIASRLRVRTLRDASVGVQHAPVGSAHGFGHPGSLRSGGPPPFGAMRDGSSVGYEPIRGGGFEYEPRSYPGPPAATGYPNSNSSMEAKIHNNTGPYKGTKGSYNSGLSEVSGPRVKLQDPQSGGSERVVEIRGPSEHLTAAYMASAGQNMNSQPGSYQNINAQQGSAQNMNAQQGSYQNMNSHQGSYQNMNAPPGSYQNMNVQQSPYPVSTQQSPYPINASQGTYPSNNAPESTYHNFSAQQGAYQY
ncbi:KH_1 domain-containing protein [Cephalotus follicularis]|uniref:KH_1 domain-containing protein n=1 Tax=Cephalotus follicularis TaxID=3775 RepID=A0A1Q3C645_CEPFO|nr:KH_1 domain-containing protein [Cephalotus follicularis]